MRFFHKFTKIEKFLILIFLIIAVFSFSKIINTYIVENSTSKPVYWWIYAEAAVWDISLINPLFSNLNPIDRDINSLIFRGLMKYEDWKIIDDIATHTLSVDKKTYIFKVKDWIKWHDWKDLTIDDIYFTYHDILQSPDFNNNSVKEGLYWVKIKLVSKNEISFTLKKPYKFFLTNLLIWIIPREPFEWIPVSNIVFSEFNFETPVWLWPYKFKSLENLWDFKKITLVKNEDFYWKKPYIDIFEYIAYKDKNIMMSNINNFSAIKPSQSKNSDISNMKNYEFVQSKYVSAFFNMESKNLKNPKIRLWIQLWTNKKEILKIVWEKHSLDTPFLELNNKNWVYEFDKSKSMWALHENWWKKPWKTEVKKEKIDDFKLKYITSHNSSILATWTWVFFLEWKVPEKTSKIFVNDYKLKAFSLWKKEFAFKASIQLWTLKNWENNFKIKWILNDWKEIILDEIKIFYLKSEEELDKKRKEINLLKNKKIIEAENSKKEIENTLKFAQKLNFRVNEKWEILTLKLVTDKNIKKYSLIADELKKQWAEIWIDVEISKVETDELQKIIELKKYDVLIYWQSLWYNLDTYSYWHSSQTWEKWLNFSNLNNFKTDVLIEKIRSTHKKEERSENLEKLAKEFQDLTPAIFLYSPVYYYLVDSWVKWVELDKIANIQDRFSYFNKIYVKEEKIINKWWLFWFFSWLKNEVINWKSSSVNEEKNIILSTWSFLLDDKKIWTWAKTWTSSVISTGSTLK